MEMLTILLVVLGIVWLSSVPFTALLLIQSAKLTRMKQRRFRNDPKKFIIQITTNSRAKKSIKDILVAIRGYHLGIVFEIWMIVEEYDIRDYTKDGADRVLRVPKDYTTKNKSLFKARALQFAREIRIKEGIEERSTKLLLLDDDSLPTKNYIEQAYHAPYDLAQGILVPRRGYGKSLLASIQDNTRTSLCVGLCSFWNQRHNPRLIHGEGLVLRGSVEKAIGWDFGVCLAEDLVFGRKASKRFTFGFLPAEIEIAPPTSLKDFMTQRKRWFWGNIMALKHLDLSQRLYILFNTFTGVGSACSTGILFAMLYSHYLPPPLILATFVSAATGWIAQYLIGCAFNTKSWKEVMKTLVLIYPTTLFNTAVGIVVIFMKPKGFEVIKK